MATGSTSLFPGTGPEYNRGITHKLLSESTSVGVNMDTLIPPHTQVIFYKYASGGNFWVAVEPSSLENLVANKDTRSELLDKSKNFDRVIMAAIGQDNHIQGTVFHPTCNMVSWQHKTNLPI